MAVSEYHEGSTRTTKSRDLIKQMASAWVRMHGSNVERQDFNASDTRTRNKMAYAIPCIFCGHGFGYHGTNQSQPYVRVAVNGNLVKKVLTKYTEVTSLQCTQCAKEKDTTRVDCYAETIGIGEEVTPDRSAVLSGRR